MKLRWIFWWIVSLLELASFVIFSVFLWMRDVDASGAVQTTELKWLNIAVLACAYLVPFVIQVGWAILNFTISSKKTSVN
ncbi:uncharacterized protein DUF3923 [Staphylococcus auricularis]|uniref:DUF3923 domain-containing protein n=1 Tax=Staphylococcus auricularis TaxID=29379 RepID=A0AAP8PPR4_9STAP|nr:DUF3923 family protein [Staphylococcus auricularis]MBM0868249.1 DUF3923 family protein [Staphylococcus auricularis]MCG7340737.1 DUF3923 family protein [Staphylococcus auricularis]MDC6327241.1 DUF3923 family protein [Staphylococcus auricularis]MDN4533049.1 DUF3923 family protein [Staphylococcus auricularis]MDN4533449.1 DUF3923 family protein [Staphylococcus auricularis]